MRKFNLLLFCGILCTALLCEASPQMYGPVKKGELLWNIATKLRPDASVTQYQVMIALLRANPNAFSVSCNMNSLKGGAILRQPSLTEIQALSPEEARKVHRQQDQAWKAYRSSKKEIVCPPVENVTTERPAEVKSVTTTGSQGATTSSVESQVTTDKTVETVPATTLAQSQEPVTTPVEKVQEPTSVATEVAEKTEVSKETSVVTHPVDAEKVTVPSTTTLAQSQEPVTTPVEKVQEPTSVATEVAEKTEVSKETSVVAHPVEAKKVTVPSTTTLAQSQEPVAAPVEKVQEPSPIAKEAIPPGPSAETTPLKTTENRIEPTTSKPVDSKPVVSPSKTVGENSQQDSIGATDHFFTTQLFSGKIVIAVIICALLSAFLIGWILHRIAQRRKPPATETLESHPLFDSIDKVLLTGQLPKN